MYNYVPGQNDHAEAKQLGRNEPPYPLRQRRDLLRFGFPWNAKANAT